MAEDIGIELNITTGGADNPAIAPRATLLDRTVCLAVNRKKFGNRRKANVANIETAADKALLSLSKRLLESAELKAVNAVDHDLNHFLDGICMPSMFKNGVYLLPIPLVERVDDELRKFADKRQEAIETFLAAYPEQVREIETRLADQYDPRNYPTVDEMRLQFGLSWQYVTFGVPGTLKAIKASLFEDEKRKYETKMQEAATEYRMLLRERMLACVAHLHEQLGQKADGTRRKVYESQVEKVTEALKLFELQDATDDTDLKPIIDQARAVMQGVDVTTIRDDEDFRKRIADGLANVVANLKTIVVDRGTREIEFEDEAAS